MFEKAVIATLITTFLALGYSGIEDSIDELTNEATVISSVMQDRELRTALEIYYSKHDTYPLYTDEDMVIELHESDCLNNFTVPYNVDYSTTKSGQNYELNIF